MKTRRPVVAGRFYPSDAESINSQIEEILNSESGRIDESLSKKNIFGGIVPHAGYMFSAYQAVHYFKIIAESTNCPDTFIIINPNHSGYGPSIALDENTFWETPLGIVGIDMAFYDALGFEKDEKAHSHEHSGEVMIPLLQYFIKKEFQIVPITLTDQSPENAELLANRIHEVNKKQNKNINIIASCDFSHYVSAEYGKENDNHAVNKILDFDNLGFYHEIKTRNISACGYGPIMSLIKYAQLISKNPKNKILRRGHSGDIVPSKEVVHYISFLFYSD